MKRQRAPNKWRKARESLGLTQKDVAESTGIPQTAISQLENGERVAKSYSRKQELCKFYKDWWWNCI